MWRSSFTPILLLNKALFTRSAPYPWWFRAPASRSSARWWRSRGSASLGTCQIRKAPLIPQPLPPHAGPLPPSATRAPWRLAAVMAAVGDGGRAGGHPPPSAHLTSFMAAGARRRGRGASCGRRGAAGRLRGAPATRQQAAAAHSAKRRKRRGGKGRARPRDCALGWVLGWDWSPQAAKGASKRAKIEPQLPAFHREIVPQEQGGGAAAPKHTRHQTAARKVGHLLSFTSTPFVTLEIQTVQSTEIQMPSGFKNLHEAVSYDPLVHLTIHLITFGLCHNKFFHHKCQGSVLACTTTKFHMAPAREP